VYFEGGEGGPGGGHLSPKRQWLKITLLFDNLSNHSRWKKYLVFFKILSSACKSTRASNCEVLCFEDALKMLIVFFLLLLLMIVVLISVSFKLNN
jgi:hypothetical protein